MRSSVSFWCVCALGLLGAVAVARAQSGAPAVAVPDAAAAPDTTAELAPADAADDPLPWGLRHRRYNTRDGATGGLFLSDPSSGAVGSVRLQLAIDTFSGTDFLRTGDDVEQSGQTLSVSWTALRFLEIYAAVHARGTSSALPVVEDIHTLGDTSFGFKAFAPVGSVGHAGGDVSLALLNDMGGSGLLLEATQIGLRGDLALDLRGLDDPVPFLGRFELGYTFDNGAKIVDREEDTRYRKLVGAMSRANEVRNLVTRFERFGLGVNRVDLLHLGLGMEFPFAITDDLYLHPIAEWRLGIPINRQGYDCAFFASDRTAGTRDGSDDACLDQAGAAAWPMNLAFGARVVPPVRGLSLTLGVDFGLTSSDDFVRELAPNPPFVLLLALGYDHDARPPPPAKPEPPPPPPIGRVRGLVVAQGTGMPVPGAAIRFVGQALDTQLADPAGRFSSPGFAPGEIPLEVTHPEYAPAPCSATIPAAGGDVDARCVLTPLPAYGRIEGRVVDLFGAPVVGARVQFVGSAAQDLATDASGAFARGDLAPGAYVLRIESRAHLLRLVRVDVAERQTAHTFATLLPRSETPGVEVRRGQIRASGLVFNGDSTELSPAAAMAVAEVADLLLRDSSIAFVRIQGDGSGGRALGRAIAVKQRLVEAGVSDARLEASTEAAKRVTITIVK